MVKFPRRFSAPLSNWPLRIPPLFSNPLFFSSFLSWQETATPGCFLSQFFPAMTPGHSPPTTTDSWYLKCWVHSVFWGIFVAFELHPVILVLTKLSIPQMCLVNLGFLEVKKKKDSGALFLLNFFHSLYSGWRKD